ncbi:serine O-acetyltransferase [Granulosicoccus sp. 3-233]|uniref:serine O-acetyltransferase n=1 Tax=Granulosicoccus sp. 3-233 TaxID=3417969 RepID=UPI003D33DCE2
MNDVSGKGVMSDVLRLLDSRPDIAAMLGVDTDTMASFADLAAAVLAGLCQGNRQVREQVARVFRENPSLVALCEHDIAETARRNFEPGGVAATMLYARGAQAVMAHRVCHQLWNEGDADLSLALKAVCGRALATDIHPGARIGAGFWLDHGLGFVAGETVVIEEEVSIWHGVTLGSTLNDSGATRHPAIGRGAVIGAGAVILGNIRVGAGANVAAGSIVLQDVPDNTAVVGTKARAIGAAKVSFIE